MEWQYFNPKHTLKKSHKEWLRLNKEHHPDKHRSSEYANRKTADINAEYQRLKKYKSEEHPTQQPPQKEEEPAPPHDFDFTEFARRVNQNKKNPEFWNNIFDEEMKAKMKNTAVENIDALADEYVENELLNSMIKKFFRSL